MLKKLKGIFVLAAVAYSCAINAAEDELQVITLEKPKAVIMGEVSENKIRLNVLANPASEPTFGVLQYGPLEEEWEDTIVFPLPRSQHFSEAVDIKDLIPGCQYEYRIGTFHIPDNSLLSRITFAWEEEEDGKPKYDHALFQAYENMVGKRDVAFLFGSCQYDGPLLDKLEKSPLGLLNLLMKSKCLRKIGFFSKLSKLPGFKKKLTDTKLGILVEMLVLAEKEGEFFRTDDSEIFKTVEKFSSCNNIALRGFIDMGDTYYRDWLNKYAGAKGTEEIYELLCDALTAEGRYEFQKTMPTYVQIDDHAVKDNFTKKDLEGENYNSLTNACWTLADILQRQMSTYDPISGHIGYRWTETRLWGLPVFIGDFRSEMMPGVEKISKAQMAALKNFLLMWGDHPKVIVSQVPIGPDDKSGDGSDKWGDEGYQSSRNDILNTLYTHKIKNTFWLGGDIHSGLFADIVHTKKEKPEAQDKLWKFPRITDAKESDVNMKRVLLAQAVASPFNWPIQFESMILDPYKPLGTSDKGSFCIVNQSSLVKQNHAGIFKLSATGDTVEITLLGNNPDNKAGEVALRKIYHLAPYQH
ncbi:alkaline phosphatase D family protein [Candidatus Odyssella thessalonicensis]|uniref:alkaline phosphatase D family protein n=1 Tax=Candidatus Odyssella thessalonicensis TaxID=84647 RepID=UPI000225B91A|nr:alkaline phosphatase D family protein [Candidatus Odyssella thessalonicensis]